MTFKSRIYTGQPNSLLRRAGLSIAKLRNAVLGAPDCRPVFVIGTGRSGTHWVGHILKSHDELVTIIERPPIFVWVTEMAIYRDRETELLPKLVSEYQAEQVYTGGKRLADKSHPNIWLVEKLLAELPDAQFVGVLRDVYGTVASTMRHPEVKQWLVDWKEYPVPNRFLGITDANKERYEALSVPARAAVRWKAHRDRLSALQGSVGASLHMVDYEALQNETMSELGRLQAFIGLKKPFEMPEVRRESLDKWKEVLSDQDISDIDAVVNDDAF